MIVTYKEVRKNVNFPAFILPSDNWDVVDGLVLVDNILVDDRNMPGDTLGVRRMQTPIPDKLPLKKAVETPLGLIKSGKKHFIDNEGKLFTYEKTRMCKLKYYKIKKIVNKHNASLLWVYTVKTPFTIPRPPEPSFKWVGILEYRGSPWMLYEYSYERKKDTRRKI